MLIPGLNRLALKLFTLIYVKTCKYMLETRRAEGGSVCKVSLGSLLGVFFSSLMNALVLIFSLFFFFFRPFHKLAT